MGCRTILLAGFILALGATAWGQSVPAAEQTKVRIGTEGAYYPFNYIDEAGKLKGFDIDIANALCTAMQAECEFVTSAWNSIIPGLLRKKYDAIIASMSITEQRKLIIDFTDKYYQTGAHFVAKKGSNLKVSRQGLAGKVIGTQRATTHQEYLLDNFQDVATVKIYDTQEHVNLDLYNGRLDAALADTLVLLEWIRRDAPDFELVGESISDPKWYGEGIGIAVRKEDTELRDRLNKALAQILTDSTYKKINDKYFPFSIY
ncbi:MAG: lysine/arginine/ornithine ABC transporter substrate-binding protein [Acidiferrobacterales bacterium]